MLAREAAEIEGCVACNHGSALGLYYDCSLKLRNKFSCLLGKHGVRHQHIVVKALTHANLGGSLVRHGADGEGEGGEAPVDFNEESASALHLQVVNLLKLTLVHSAASIVLLGLALARGDKNIKANDIAGAELPLSNILGARHAVDNDIVAINKVALDFVGEDTLDGVALELLGNLLDHLADASVSGTLGNFTLGGLEGVPCGENNISLAASHRSVTDDHSSGRIRCKSIEVCAGHTITNRSRQGSRWLIHVRIKDLSIFSELLVERRLTFCRHHHRRE